MAKNMYQKREERKQSKANNTDVENKTNINWDIGTNVKPFSIPYKISISLN